MLLGGLLRKFLEWQSRDSVMLASENGKEVTGAGNMAEEASTGLFVPAEQ